MRLTFATKISQVHDQIEGMLSPDTAFNMGVAVGLIGGVILAFAIFGGWVLCRVSNMMKLREREYAAQYNRIVNTPHHSGEENECSICQAENSLGESRD